MTKIVLNLFSIRQMQLSSKVRTALIVLLVIVLGWFLVKGCNRLTTPEAKRVYHIARKEVIYPVNLGGRERYLSAFTDDVIRAIAKVENIPVDISIVSYSDPYQSMENDHFDGIITMHLPSIEKRNKYLISEPFFVLGPVVVTRKNSSILNVQDLKGKIIGVPAGQPVVNEIEKVPDIYIVTYDTYTIALDNLINNKIDAVVMDVWPAYIFLKGFYSDMLKITTAPINESGLRLIVRNDPTGQILLERFNDGLSEIRSNGTYDSLIKSWSLINTLGSSKK